MDARNDEDHLRVSVEDDKGCCSNINRKARHVFSDFCGLLETSDESAHFNEKWLARTGSLADHLQHQKSVSGDDEVDFELRSFIPSKHIDLAHKGRRSMRRIHDHSYAAKPSILSVVGGWFKNKVSKEKLGYRKPEAHSRSLAPSAIMSQEIMDTVDMDIDDTFFDEACGSTLVCFDEVDAGLARPQRRSPQWDSSNDWHFRSKPDTHGMQNKIRQQIRNNANRMEEVEGFFRSIWTHGVMEQLCGIKYKSRQAHEQRDQSYDHRPYFTYWLTLVQILIYIASVSVYGIAPIGVGMTDISAEVIMPNLAREKVSYKEISNFWIGPRQADLVHLGAKFSPCMRVDDNIVREVDRDREAERLTACCINNDGSGCVQTSKAKCLPTLSTWFKWKNYSVEANVQRNSGSVCGQDPRYCTDPVSQAPFLWKDDITKWPICYAQLSSNRKTDRHMRCELLGRPCCVSIQGECIVTTRDHCQFLRGHFHEDAVLCSQVSCMNEICGMLPFFNPEKPDQFYRFWTCLFLHAGFIHLLVTILVNLFIMRQLEKMAGWIRIGSIYFGSGLVGSLASAIFLPYYVEAGPAGAQFGILACQLVYFVLKRDQFQSATKIILKLVALIVLLFLIGLFPMIDNFAHLFGFLFGMIASFLVLPYAKMGNSRPLMIVVCVICCLIIVVSLILLFYFIPIYECKYCHYLTCIPFTADFCKTTEMAVRRENH